MSIGVSACALIGLALGVAWHAKRSSLNHSPSGPTAVSAPARLRALPVAAPPPSKPTMVDAAGLVNAAAGSAKGAHSAPGSQLHGPADNALAAPASEGEKTPRPGVSQVSAVEATKNPAALRADDGVERDGKPVENATTATAPAASATDGAGAADEEASGQAKHRKPNERNVPEVIPARIVAQSQPSIPPWAKGLELDEVVTLDAIIDEKGNVTETRLLSGPRVLQHAAEGAVALWIFEPAQADGKPTATHMVLTVQFQR
jgi:outer membrane biosynthesis protein TonB